MIRTALILGVSFISAITQAGDSLTHCGTEAKSCLSYGANVFQERCSLCHGTDGLGEGILSISLPDYPPTNLLDPRLSKELDSIKNIITHGSSLENVSTEMPPWGDELTLTQLESVSEFVNYLRTDTDAALKYLKIASANMNPSMKIGRATFLGRCSLCHGKYGLGDGKMSRIIKNPPPFNLTLSRSPDNYLSEIIHKGGAAMGRSPRMPPFGGDLSDTEIKSIILYIKTLRTED
jgi:cytochrome c oxidase cbb3-type subunit 3